MSATPVPCGGERTKLPRKLQTLPLGTACMQRDAARNSHESLGKALANKTATACVPNDCV
jgi:hypothetical protein